MHAWMPLRSSLSFLNFGGRGNELYLLYLPLTSCREGPTLEHTMFPRPLIEKELRPLDVAVSFTVGRSRSVSLKRNA